MAVVAVLVVGGDHLRPAVPDQGDQMVGGLQQVGGPERALRQLVAGDDVALLVGGHPRVVVVTLPAQPDVVGDSQGLHGPCEFPDAVRSEFLGAQVLQLGNQDLAQLSEGAGDQRHLCALVDVARHRGGGLRRLIVGMGMDEHQTAVRHNGKSSSFHGQCAARQPGPLQRGFVGLLESMALAAPEFPVRPTIPRDRGAGLTTSASSSTQA